MYMIEPHDKNAVQEEIRQRQLPDFLRWEGTCIKSVEEWESQRGRIRKSLCEELYGILPYRQEQVVGEVMSDSRLAYGGKAMVEEIRLTVRNKMGFCTIPFNLAKPHDITKPPVFLLYSWGRECSITEELLDSGYAVLNVNYQEIAPDRPGFYGTGIMHLMEEIPHIGWGKVAMWAYGAIKIMDYLTTRDDLDNNRVALVGHSRLGKSALFAGALDRRFSLVAAAGSGTGGAALYRGNIGEPISPEPSHWFCEKRAEYAENVEGLPIDAHFLIAMRAPRHIYISSESDYAWSDPRSEFLSCVAASPAYTLYEKQGLIYNGYPQHGEAFEEGSIAYHYRKGFHGLVRENFHRYMKYREKFHI